jgi:hypothetical protein
MSAGAQQPTLAELARTALDRADVGTLISRGGPATPAVLAVVRIAAADGRPVVELEQSSFMVGRLAACRVATIAVPAETPFKALQLTGSMMRCEPVDGGARAYRLSPLSARLVGARSISVPLGAFQAARPDPLWRHAVETVGHLARGHAADLLACVRANGFADVQAAELRAIDRYGLEFALITGTGVGTARLPFPDGPVESMADLPGGLRAVLLCRCRGCPGRRTVEG